MKATKALITLSAASYILIEAGRVDILAGLGLLVVTAFILKVGIDKVTS
ncbi:hypothetical protein ACPSKX_16155 [Moritella viscosa]|nr:hypothetical protein [Moritella viscosa]SHO14430.1 Putative uncharacterized protein [Moritella viscosa]